MARSFLRPRRTLVRKRSSSSAVIAGKWIASVSSNSSVIQSRTTLPLCSLGVSSPFLVTAAVTLLDGDLQTVDSRLDELAIGLDVIEIDRHGFLLFGFRFLVNVEAAQTEFSQPVFEPAS